MEYLRELNLLSIIVRIVLAILIGGVLGLERERKNRPAGFRTYILVCLGAALVMMTNQYVYYNYATGDPVRMGAQVISGIGFLGAGTIIRNGSSVKGLTTAASIWVVACIGLATGMGFYFGATIATVIIFLCLAHIKKLSGFYDSKKISLTVTSETGMINNIIDTMEKIFSENSIKVNTFSISSKKDSCSEILFHLTMNDSVNPTSVLSNIYSLPGILSVNLNSKKIIKEEE